MGWIKISDKKPGWGQEVIIFADGEVLGGFSYYPPDSEDIEFCCCCHVFLSGHVTHWMPMPSEPEVCDGVD